ncbi:SDR family oxidoreductase [Allokutzneria albata]|uniref:NADP-dependent 3-hydroxy acid dehydrogenase YdfG n=1 Tax=Allokutzneria albata TaxID=211114 RepID=A0A1G9UNP0_ALLAB|nr:SDR family oxidoreductase [Allokutzneria albata]SDM61447.1 NADP-dependent 3-hydroxy acid dehydrogenase YdfG [Allokutzneria albata]
MRIIVVGATGILGSTVSALLSDLGHEVIRASWSGPVHVDLTDPSTLDKLFATVTDVDAVVCTAAHAPLKPLLELSDADFRQVKLDGQLALFRRAVHALRDGGRIVLTAGRFEGPMCRGAVGAMVNAALEAFVENARGELPRGIDAAVMSPGWVSETLASMGRTGGTPAVEVARGYVDFVLSAGS